MSSEQWGSAPSLPLPSPKYGERGARAYNGGLGRSPQRDPGAEPLGPAGGWKKIEFW